MEVYLIRHTKPAIDKKICYGHSDVKLAATFEQEVESIISKYPELKQELTVFSSPLERCRKLAQKLFRSPIRFRDELKELNFGEWELKAWDEIDQVALNKWMKDFVQRPCPAGESYADLSKRVLHFTHELYQIPANKIAIVTHAGVIRAFLAHHQQIPLEESFSIKIEYGSVYKLNV